MSGIREVHRVSWLKKITSNDKKKTFKNPHVEKVWMVFCIHDERFPFLEQYKSRVSACSHLPLFAYPLTECCHVSTSIRPTLEGEHEFVVTLRRDVVKFSSPKRELVAEWVSILRVQLRQLRVFQAPINVYSRAPRPKLSLPAASQQAAVAGGGPRDPTSPLPAPPVVVPTTESHSPVTAAPVSSSSACQRFSFCSAAESSACGDAAAADYSCPSVTSCTCSAVIDDCTASVSYVAENAYSTRPVPPVTNQAEPELPAGTDQAEPGLPVETNQAEPGLPAGSNHVEPKLPTEKPVGRSANLSRHVTVISVGDPLLMLTLDGRCTDAEEERCSRTVQSAGDGRAVSYPSVPCSSLQMHYSTSTVSSPTAPGSTLQLHSSTSLPLNMDMESHSAKTYGRPCDAFSTSNAGGETPTTAGRPSAGPSAEVPGNDNNSSGSVGRDRVRSVCPGAVRRSHSSSSGVSDRPGHGPGGTHVQNTLQRLPARLALLYRQNSDISLTAAVRNGGDTSASADQSGALTHTTLGDCRSRVTVRHDTAVRPLREGGRAAPLSMREQQVCQLRGEMSCRSGIRVALPRRTVLSALVFAEAHGALWLCGWRWRDQPALSCALHLGDSILSVCGISVNSQQKLNRALKQLSCTPLVELLLRRLPNAMVMMVDKESEGQSLGVVRGHGTSEVTQVLPDGLAAKYGLSCRSRSMVGSSLCNWYISEVNGRPLSLFARDDEIERRLSPVGRQISLVLLPIDLVQLLKRHLRNLGRSYKQFVVQ